MFERIRNKVKEKGFRDAGNSHTTDGWQTPPPADSSVALRMARPSLDELFCPDSAVLGNRRPFKARSVEWSQEQNFGMISAASKVKEGGYGAASTRDVESMAATLYSQSALSFSQSGSNDNPTSRL